MISDNVEEAVSGVKGENSIKVFGPDLEMNEKNADEIVDVMAQGPRASRTSACSTRSGSRTSRSRPTARACARYGLNTGDVDAVIQAAIGGQARDAGLRGREALRPDRALASRSTAEPRGHPRDHGRRRRTAARSRSASSRTSRSKRGRRSSTAKTGALRAGEVLGARARSRRARSPRRRQQADRVDRPSGQARRYDTHLEWGGEINELQRGDGAARVIIPLTLLLIAFLVYSAVKNWVDTLIVLSTSRWRARAASSRCSSRA